MFFYTHLLLLLQPIVLWLYIVTFNNDAKLPPKWILRESDPGKASYPTLKRLHGKIWPRLRGLPGLANRATRLGGSSHLSCKRDQIEWVIIWTPTRGSPPPCKQALGEKNLTSNHCLKSKSDADSVFWNPGVVNRWKSVSIKIDSNQVIFIDW